MAKKIEIDLARVEDLAANGLSESEVAASMGFSRHTIQRRKRDDEAFATAWKRGRERAHAEVTNALMSLIRDRNLGAVVWYEKTRKGYSDRVQQEVMGKDGNAIEIKQTVFDHSAAIASIASRSAGHPAEPSENENRGDGQTLG